jgi:hypothetical protein
MLLNKTYFEFHIYKDYSLHKWRIDAQVHKTPPEECNIST